MVKPKDSEQFLIQNEKKPEVISPGWYLEWQSRHICIKTIRVGRGKKTIAGDSGDNCPQ